MVTDYFPLNLHIAYFRAGIIYYIKGPDKVSSPLGIFELTWTTSDNLRRTTVIELYSLKVKVLQQNPPNLVTWVHDCAYSKNAVVEILFSDEVSLFSIELAWDLTWATLDNLRRILVSPMSQNDKGLLWNPPNPLTLLTDQSNHHARTLQQLQYVTEMTEEMLWL